jgi:hypothetical protein
VAEADRSSANGASGVCNQAASDEIMARRNLELEDARGYGWRVGLLLWFIISPLTMLNT